MIERVESATFVSRGQRYSFRRVQRAVAPKPMRVTALPVGQVRPVLCPECFATFVVPVDPSLASEYAARTKARR